MTTHVTRATKRATLRTLRRLWAQHDRLERRIIRLERRFTDRELTRMLER